MPPSSSSLLVLLHLSLLLLTSQHVVIVSAEKNNNNFASNVLWKQARRWTPDLSHLIGSPRRTSKTPYDRVMGHPVFQVTTPWGAPYMNFEKVERGDSSFGTTTTGGGDMMGADSESRPVTLFYMDPQDAIQMHQEMKQMGNMGNADIRLTTTTLSKALRQSSNFGNGLVTGTPVDPLTGKLPTPSQGGSLRYKIVPPKRQLFYAARCVGKERVGLFGRDALEDAETYVEGSNYIHQVNLDRRSDAKERKSKKGRTATQLNNAHMEGYTGIPVFYAPELKRVLPKLKQLTCGTKEENPFFFSYEDLMDAWDTMKRRNKKQKVPDKPASVEVYNLMDVLTSMEREEWVKRRGRADSIREWAKDPVGTLKSQFKRQGEPSLDTITFVPPSNCVKYKEAISKRGNGKARLRPMREITGK